MRALVVISLLATACLLGCGGDDADQAVDAAPTTTTLDPYGDDPPFDQGTPAGIEFGNQIVTSFLAAENGTPHAFARRTGVQEIIWHGHCWHPDDADVLRAADMEECGIGGHDNHVHLTLSHAGADGETSWYQR